MNDNIPALALLLVIAVIAYGLLMTILPGVNRFLASLANSL